MVRTEKICDDFLENPMTDISFAHHVVETRGWLAAQSKSFRQDLLRRSTVIHAAPGEYIYRRGEGLGGIYGLVSGIVTVDTAPPGCPSRLVQIGVPGSWTGEGCFLSRQPRRLDLQARSAAQLIHLPLASMDDMAAADPACHRAFAQILVASVDTLQRIAQDLQIPHVERRLASTLQRLAAVDGRPLPVNQTELGVMANASRKQVAAALKRFHARGWVEETYRRIVVKDREGLEAYAKQG